MEKEHRYSTLMNYTKKQLVEHCMCLEHNNNVLEQNFNQQYLNVLQLLDDMKLVNDTYKNRKKPINFSSSTKKEEIKYGEWLYSPHENMRICSVCGYEHWIGSLHQYAMNGCPNCVTRMKEER